MKNTNSNDGRSAERQAHTELVEAGTGHRRTLLIVDDDEDFKVDDEFKDLFNDKDLDDDDEDDDY